MKILESLFAILGVVLLVSCGRTFDFSKVEVIDVKVGPSGKFAVAYYSNETVNVYSFNKLITSFQRRAVFVSTSDKIYGGYFLVKDFGFLSDGRIYIVAYKPTLGWLVRIGDKEIGYYSYVSQFKFSSNSKLVGYVYNVGGEFSNDSVVGGKYYVNVNGMDMGPYDLVGELILSRNEDFFAFSYSNNNRWYVRVSDYEYVCYNEVILPNEFSAPEDIKFAYRIRRDWFLHPSFPISRNVYKITVFDNYLFFILTNSNSSLISNKFTNFSVEGIVLDVKFDGENALILIKTGDKQKMLFNNTTITMDSITKYELVNKKVVYKGKIKDEYYIGINEKLLGPYEFADFHVDNEKITIGYVRNKKLYLTYENF